MAAPWLDVLDDTIRACESNRRQDLAGPLRHRRAALIDPKLRVLVIGNGNQGKSQLVNALINAQVCAVGDDRTTMAPAVISHAEAPAAAMVTDGQPDARPAIGGAERVPVPVDSVTALANREAAGPLGDRVRAEIGLPRTLLATGLVLVDTPAAQIAGPVPAVPAMLAQADAVLLATDATAELTVAELELLASVTALCPTVAVALTKIDLIPDWRGVAERNRARLAGAGLPDRQIPVSAALRLAAARAGDRELNEESGFADLVRWLHQDVLGQAELLARRSVRAVAGMAVEHLIAPLERDFAVTQESGTGPAVADWHAAGRRIEELQRESSRWQTRLSDEVADLIADVEYDLRDRTRRILREVDEFFDVADPARSWPEFQEWLRENLTTVAETNFDWLLARFDWIARTIAHQVAQESTVLPDLVANGTLDLAGVLRMPSVERFGVAQKLFVGMRGSYGGLLMIGLATTLAGFPLINPISIGAGAAFGVKSVFEERGARLKRRQGTAKSSVQRHVDDFFLNYGKYSKDAARLLHRELRDRFTALAEQRRAELTEAARTIKQAIDTDTERRGRRANEIRRSMAELVALRTRIHAIGGTSGTRATPAIPSQRRRRLTA